ncbi:uncharacterized protein LOC5511434 isoform X2 [Nematostella vectensis]|uniref:uncharacterized protein LOC5511434 isoform X2 n=1 Tax=Nematostella vectensis TaxID=45351 RepID=UPI0020772071|nr:uncharacterized protein LOC5511434 isoform X2 [Nematostella vectensis]
MAWVTLLMLLNLVLVDAIDNMTADCSFERGSMCNWENVVTVDEFDWSLGRGETPSAFTGPRGDHTTGSGTYLFIEASYPRGMGDFARITSPPLTGPQCLMFWYHMYGGDMGRLIVQVNTTGGVRALWFKAGEHGQTWRAAQVDIQEKGEFNIFIDGIVGKSFQGDAAIDDITFHPGKCNSRAVLSLYLYADETGFGFLSLNADPSPGVTTFLQNLELSQASLNHDDDIYLLCRDSKGVYVSEMEKNPRLPLKCPPWDFFFSPRSARKGLLPVFVIDRGSLLHQIVSFHNKTLCCDVPTKNTVIYALNTNFTVNPLHGAHVLQSSQMSAFPGENAVDGDHSTCAKTNSESNPWFEASLSRARHVYKVYLSSRRYCCDGYPLNNINVTISDEQTTVTCLTTDRRATECGRSFLCQPPIRALKVQVKIVGEKQQLVLCEIAVNTVDSPDQLRGVRREIWHDMGSNPQLESFTSSASRLGNPNSSGVLTEFKAPDIDADNYGQRLTAFVQPPLNGSYMFYTICDDQCKTWINKIEPNTKGELAFIEDLGDDKQLELQLSHVTTPSGYYNWDRIPKQQHSKPVFLDSCRTYMLEGLMKESSGMGYLGLGWKHPDDTLERPIKTAQMFWMLPGIQSLEVALFDAIHNNVLAKVGENFHLHASYKSCCIGIYCPTCRMTVIFHLIGYEIPATGFVDMTCEPASFIADVTVNTAPGTYPIQVSQATQDCNLHDTKQVVGYLEVQALVVESCLFPDDMCSWINYDNKGLNGWKLLTAPVDTIDRYFVLRDPKTAWLESSALKVLPSYRHIGLCLRFQYLMTAETVNLDVIAKTPTNRTVVWRLYGLQGADWQLAVLPWPVMNDTQIAFKGWGQGNGSIGVSRIRLTTESCHMQPLHAHPSHSCHGDQFQCLNGMCVGQELRCDGDYACVDHSDERNCACRSAEFKCPDGKCVHPSKFCNGESDCTDGSDEWSCDNSCSSRHACADGTCVTWSLTCNGVSDCQDGSDEPKLCESLSCPLDDIRCSSVNTTQCQGFRGTCSFENGLCGLISNSTCETEWIVGRGPTPTSNTGPDGDHTTGTETGSYLYLEASGTNSGDHALLQSDWLLHDDVMCLQLWYHMYGRHTGTLQIHIRTNTSNTVVWRVSGANEKQWVFGQTPINTDGKRFKFIVEGIAGAGSEGDIAIDDLGLVPGPCDLVQDTSLPDCLFKDGLCEWQSVGWVHVAAADSLLSPAVPQPDSGPGIVRTSPSYQGQGSLLLTPQLDPSDGYRCARFWYFIVTLTSYAKGSLSVSSVDSRGFPDVLLNMSRRTRRWIHAQVGIDRNVPYKIRFSANMPIQGEAFAIDDVTFTKEPCQTMDANNQLCRQRTTDGDCCVFPFVFKGKCYPWCIGDGVNRIWCATTDNFDRDGLWGSCDEGSGPAIIEPCAVRTKQGQCCVFPFQYGGISYSQCTTDYHTGPWCSLTKNYDRDYLWGDCLVLADDDPGRQVCDQFTTDGRCCVLPFIYDGKTYNTCVTYRNDRPWCALTANYDRDGRWAPCAGYDDPDDCASIYNNTNTEIHWTSNEDAIASWVPRGDDDLDDVTKGSRVAQDHIFYEAIFNNTSREEHIIVRDIPKLRSFTVCTWLCTDDVTMAGTPFRYEVLYQERYVTGFSILNYRNLVISVMGQTRVTAIALNDGKWRHVCLTWASRGGVWQLFTNGALVANGYDWHKDAEIPGSGKFIIAWDGLNSSRRFLGKMSGLNLWSDVLGADEISQRALGCGLEEGNVKAWSSFRSSLSTVCNVSSPAGCSYVQSGGYILKSNDSSAKSISATLETTRFMTITGNDVSKCFYFRFMMIGSGEKELELFHKSGSKSRDETLDGVLWIASDSSSADVPIWKSGFVSVSTLKPFKMVVRGTIVPGQGAVAIAKSYLRPGPCKSFSFHEIAACQQNLTSPSGTFVSPRYPNPYPNNIDCVWRIIRDPSDVIRLRILAFDLQLSTSCTKDSLTIIDGVAGHPQTTGRYCGTFAPSLIQSTSSVVTLIFKSGGVNSGQGFKISYKAINNASETREVCSQIEDCPSSCSCVYTSGSGPRRILVKGQELTAIPKTMPLDTFALMFSSNRITNVDSRSFKEIPYLQYIDLSRNNIFRISQDAFHDLSSLATLRLQSNFITRLSIEMFKNLMNLRTLDIGNNLIKDIPSGVFANVRDLQVLSFQSNKVSNMDSHSFATVNNLTHLYLQNNKITALSPGVFANLSKLQVLYLNGNRLKKLSRDVFRGLVSLRELNLHNNEITTIDEDTFTDLTNLKKLTMDCFLFCCYAVKTLPGIECNSSKNAFSSCDDLMKNKALQVCIWILGSLALLGNLCVVVWRIIVTERNKAHSFLLTNLAVADWLMGCYLIIIAIKDLEWRGEYFKHDVAWRSSRLCQFAGALSMISSEVSVLILTTITADRFACIVFAFKFRRLKFNTAVYIAVSIWLFGIIVSVLPILGGIEYFYDHSWQAGFYGRSAVCLPLQLSQERYPGWEYSVTLFIGLNAVAFSFILIAYIAMFWKVRTVSRGVRSTQIRTESSVAKRMVFIILTDFCCWMPVIVIGVLSLLGKFPDPEKQVYVWTAVFVLPVNSSINPVLYTFSTREWRRTSDAQGYAHSVMALTSRVRQTISVAFRGGRSREECIEMSTDPSTAVTRLRAPRKFGSSRSLCTTRNSIGERPVPKVKVIGPTTIFRGEFSPSVGFYMVLCEGKRNTSMCLLKHFASNQRVDWAREVEVLMRLHSNGSHANIIQYMWHGQGFCATTFAQARH